MIKEISIKKWESVAMKKIAVAGTGYVGLVAGVCFAEVGHDVTCVDVDENKVKLMESGVSPIYEDGLEELMKKNNATGHLRYTTDYKAAYKDADAIVIASYHEGMSNVLLEAAATGRPVLATNIPGCKEAVDDHMTGMLFKSRSAEAMESTIEYFLSMSIKQRETMGQAARAKMEQEFDRKRVVESYMEEIEKILGN